MFGYRPVLLPEVRLAGAGRELIAFAATAPSSALSQGTPYPSKGEAAALRGVLAAGILFGGAAGYVGIRTALKERGWLSAAGWVSGIGGTLIGLFNLVTLGAVAVKEADRNARTSEV